MLEEEDSPFLTGSDPVNVKNDFPKWVEPSTPPKSIDLSLCLSKLTVRQTLAWYSAVVKQLQLKDPPDNLAFTILTSYSGDHRGEPTVRVHVGAKEFTGIEAQQVLKLVQSSRGVLFHNSTTQNPYSHQEGISRIKDLSGETAEIIARTKVNFEKALKKIAKNQQGELEQLLGRLEGKYKVTLSIPSFDPSWMPLNVSLGEKKYGVPLNEWGSGTKNRTQILLALFRAKQISNAEVSASKITPLLIVEEPECFLHPSAQAEFGRVLQDLAEEFGIQVTVTTHSPYMLSLTSTPSNVLLDRRPHYGQARETIKIDSAWHEKWMKTPFGHVLGMSTEEFKPWKKSILHRLIAAESASESILLVEGETDKQYFELLRSDEHRESTTLDLMAKSIAYDGILALFFRILLLRTSS